MEASGAAHRRRLQLLRAAALSLVALAFCASVYIAAGAARLSQNAAGSGGTALPGAHQTPAYFSPST